MLTNPIPFEKHFQFLNQNWTLSFPLVLTIMMHHHINRLWAWKFTNSHSKPLNISLFHFIDKLCKTRQVLTLLSPLPIFWAHGDEYSSSLTRRRLILNKGRLSRFFLIGTHRNKSCCRDYGSDSPDCWPGNDRLHRWHPIRPALRFEADKHNVSAPPIIHHQQGLTK